MKGFILWVIFIQISERVWCMQTYYMSDMCGERIVLSYEKQIRIQSVPYGEYLPSIRNCEMAIVCTGNLDRLMIYFKDLNIEDGSDGSCSKDYLTIYDDGYLSEYSQTETVGKPRFCGYTTPSTVYESSGDSITLSFNSDPYLELTGFDVIVTQFHERFCHSWEMKCSNGKCIDEDLACNGYNPCGDESDCRGNGTTFIAATIVGTVALVAILISIVAGVFYIKRRHVGRTGYVTRDTPIVTTIETTASSATTSSHVANDAVDDAVDDESPSPYSLYSSRNRDVTHQQYTTTAI